MTAGAPAPLGVSEAELRDHFGAALREATVKPLRSIYDQIAEAHETKEERPPAEAPRDLFARQKRLTRTGTGDVQRIDFDLHADRTYRVRWQLAARFEHPLMAGLVARLSERLGEPDYDQTLRATLGSDRSELRRSGWAVAGRAFELRQLHPFTGGPIFLSLADRPALQAIVDAGGTPLAQPDRTGEWWRRPQRAPVLLSDSERDALVADALELVDSLLSPR